MTCNRIIALLRTQLVLRMMLSLCPRHGHGRWQWTQYTQDLGPSPISLTLTLSTGTADCVLWTRSSLGAGCEPAQQRSSPANELLGQRFREVETRKGRGRASAPCRLQEGGSLCSPQTLSVGFPGDWLSSHQRDKPLLCPVATGLTRPLPESGRSSSCPVGWRMDLPEILRSQGAGHPGWWEGRE